jgi:hypothetical protein
VLGLRRSRNARVELRVTLVHHDRAKRHAVLQLVRLPIAPPEATIIGSSIFAAYRASREVAPKDAGKDAGPWGKRSNYPFAQYRASGEMIPGFGGNDTGLRGKT